MPEYTGTDGASSILSNCLSWSLDLKGSSLTINAAYYGRMNALKIASQALRSGDSNMINQPNNLLFTHIHLTKLQT